MCTCIYVWVYVCTRVPARLRGRSQLTVTDSSWVFNLEASLKYDSVSIRALIFRAPLIYSFRAFHVSEMNQLSPSQRSQPVLMWEARPSRPEEAENTKKWVRRNASESRLQYTSVAFKSCFSSLIAHKDRLHTATINT